MLNSNNHLLSRSKKEIMVQKNHKKNFNNTRRNVRMIKGNNIVDLFSEFQSNPNNHYAIGYDLNNLNKLTFSMMDFMVFLKKARYDDISFVESEVCGSRIAEVLGINTPFITFLDDKKDTSVSVNFLCEDENFITFDTALDNTLICKNSSIINWINGFEDFLNLNNLHEYLSDTEISSLKKDIIKIYLIRKFVLVDNDFNSGNVALIYDNNAKFKIMSFDYEFCFGNELKYASINDQTPVEEMLRSRKELLDFNLTWLTENYPNELISIMDDLNLSDNQQKKMLDAIDSCFHTNQLREYWKYRIQENIKFVLEGYNNIIVNQSVQEGM